MCVTDKSAGGDSKYNHFIHMWIEEITSLYFFPFEICENNKSFFEKRAYKNNKELQLVLKYTLVIWNWPESKLYISMRFFIFLIQISNIDKILNTSICFLSTIKIYKILKEKKMYIP